MQGMWSLSSKAPTPNLKLNYPKSNVHKHPTDSNQNQALNDLSQEYNIAAMITTGLSMCI